MRKMTGLVLGVVVLVGSGSRATADTIVLQDGTTLNNCFARDEAIHYLVWEKMADVGTPKMRVIPRSEVKEWKVERDAAWDQHPALPDLSVTFIEMNPKLAGLHWHVNYDQLGRPVLGGAKALVELGERAAMDPEGVVKNLKLRYNPGEEITLTAHVKNVGFSAAKAFAYIWLIDGKEFAQGTCDKALKELEEVTFPLKWQWQDGRHTVTFRIVTSDPEIATLNNEATDALWGWGFVFVINKGRTWHEVRNACGSFCFEDYYRWHIELMNTLFAASVFPSAPEGIQARVRLDRIVYCDDPNGDKSLKLVTAEDGMGYLQGMWTWTDQPGEKEKNWPTSASVRSTTEWSLPHELGHQLGIIDYYALDNEGAPYHLWPDNSDKVTHLMKHSIQMMHWHGPHLYGEADAGYFNMTWDKPRGHFGDYCFAIPRENVLRFLDVNAEPVAGAKVEIFQRGIKLDPNGQPGEDHGVKYMQVLEDGDWGAPFQSKDPVITGTTDPNGLLRLPNRPVAEVRTLNGFHRQPNPFGNVNVVGNRGQLLVRVTQGQRQEYYWLEVTDFNVAWFRGHKDSYTMTLKTPFGSVDSPLPPVEVAATRSDDQHVKVTWRRAPIKHEMQYLERALGFRVYRRRSNMGLNDRPWFPVASLGPDAREFIVDMTQWPCDTDFYQMPDRFAVSSLSELGVESELVEVPLMQK